MSDAELVFLGGPVFTATTVRSRTDAVAVRAGRIVALGAEARELVGAGTEVIDLAGRMLVPGFQDAHVHPVSGGLELLSCDLNEGRTAAEYVAIVAEYAAAHPDEEWITGGGWSMSAFPGGTPTAALLDEVVRDRPVFLPNRDGHGAWVNSRALELAGIDASTPDPADGRIERDAHGAPSGTLHEGAMSLVDRLIPPVDDDGMLAGLLRGQSYLHSFGITSWQDAIIGGYADLRDAGATYLRADAEGLLTGRVVGALWWDRTAGLEQIDSLVERRERYRSANFRATSVKIMQDGVAENFTAAMIDPYHDGHGHPTDNSGISFVPPEILNEAVPRLDALGFQVHFHAIGDRAVRQCLDAVEHAIAANGRLDNRPHIAHIQVIHPDDVPRFRELGVAANMQSYWATLEPQMIDLTIPFLGEQRSAWQYPFGDLQRAGAVLAAGSDWSVSTPDPLAAIHTAVNRTAAPGHEDGEYPPFHPEQGIDLATSLTAYTAGSAWVNHREADTGTIETGKLADLVVLDRDPFDGPADQIGATRVLQTFVGGRRVYAAPDA
ncbi:amidohydrolase [Homoserinibacter sp. GY 40078]|uniref:amidohydrolase n=1 Tax=Homoserinibacter sp. GY 40078 TaxID=2603275 RepID=UPI0011C97929|nr:amidohydrolase [Homoserinibacter sp. GY 40078]TXK18705.1 amidohydrolase [Homoserinibacter sp. GY 40078]